MKRKVKNPPTPHERIDRVENSLASMRESLGEPLYSRLLMLEQAAKQSPSDRCLFVQTRKLAERIEALERSRWAISPVVVQTKSPREQYLERHCEWLTKELARYTQ